MKLYLLNLKKDLMRTRFYVVTLQTEPEEPASLSSEGYVNFYIPMRQEEVINSSINQIESAAIEKAKQMKLCI